MRTEPLEALVADVLRLLAAGAPACVGDTRLAERAAALNRLAGRVPALRTLADATTRLSKTTPVEAAALLLDLLVRLQPARAALATSGIANGEAAALPPSGPWETTLPLPELDTWRKDLRQRPTPACKRLTVYLDAGGRPDLRLLDLLPDAAAAVYGSNDSRLTPRRLAPWVAPLLPDVRARYRLPGEDLDPHRLALLCRLDPALGLHLCREALEHGSVPVQRMAARWLAELAEPAEVLARLGPRVGQLPNEMVQPVAVALGRTGPDLIPRLLDLLRPPYSNAWWQASMVLRELARHQADALRPHTPRLLDALDHAERLAFDNLIHTLADLQPLPEDPTSRLLALLDRRGARWGVLRGMASLDFRWDLARWAVLHVARKDPDTWTRRDAQYCLARAAAAGVVEAAETLVELLGDAPNYWPNVARMFAKLKPVAELVVPRLIRVLERGDAWLCAEALHALDGLGAAALPAAAAVIERARAGQRDAVSALALLGRLGGAVPEGLPLILAALNAADSNTRCSAWNALECYRPRRDVPAAPLTAQLLGAPDFWARRNAAQFLGRLGADAASAVPALRRALRDREPDVRKAAGAALARIEGAAK